jgi:hypothetical protein
MRQVRAELPGSISDARAHCLASAGIARRCGGGEAWLAGWGKELKDLLGRGDASRADIAANAAGRRCAAQTANDEVVPTCCAAAGY